MLQSNQPLVALQESRLIFFVVHSLAGIVCAKALVLSLAKGGAMAQIGKHVRGIAFLATPFRGSEKADWAKQGETFLNYFGQKLASDTLQMLIKESYSLMDSIVHFGSHLHSRLNTIEDIKVTFFLRGRREQFSDREDKVSEKNDAILDGLPQVNLPGNHSSICKSSSADETGYKRNVNEKLKVWLREIAESADDLTEGYNVVQHGSFFGSGNSGMQVGNAFTTGRSPAVGGTLT